jgi:hypothetical protein
VGCLDAAALDRLAHMRRCGSRCPNTNEVGGEVVSFEEGHTV